MNPIEFGGEAAAGIVLALIGIAFTTASFKDRRGLDWSALSAGLAFLCFAAALGISVFCNGWPFACAALGIVGALFVVGAVVGYVVTGRFTLDDLLNSAANCGRSYFRGSWWWWGD